MRVGTGGVYRTVVVGLVVLLSGIPLSWGQATLGAGSLMGRIFDEDGITPRSGVVVKVAHLASSEIYASEKTDESKTICSSPSGTGWRAFCTRGRDSLPTLDDLNPGLCSIIPSG